MCIACRKVCFSDVAARKLCFTRCVGVGVGLVLASQEEGRMAEGSAGPAALPVTTQNPGSSGDVLFLSQRPPDLAQLMTDINEALRHVGVFSTIPPTPSPFSWLDPSALPLGEAEPRVNFLDCEEEGGNVELGEDSGMSDFGEIPLIPPEDDVCSTHSQV